MSTAANRAPVRPGALDDAVRLASPERVGRVSSVVGLALDVRGVSAVIGDVVEVGPRRAGERPALAEVVANLGDTLRLMPLTPLTRVGAGSEARRMPYPALVPTGDALLGRVIDGLGRPIDGLGPLEAARHVELQRTSPSALERARITQPLQTGVRVLDTLTTLARGQRMGLFAGSGVGKSSLLSMIARGTDAGLSVIALVGERGREVREFIEDDLGADGLARSVVVVATADEPALMRRRAAFLATRVAEAFRDDGRDAVLMMDSLTRVAMAQREIGLSAGEPPATRGYPPSTFSTLAQLLERAGTAASGAVTGIYTVLVDGDDHNEPVADAARSMLDGHVVLRRELAVAGRYPAVDPLASLSRLASKVNTPEHSRAAAKLRQVIAAHQGARDLLDVGAYRPGANPLVDAAIAHESEIDAFLVQGSGEHTSASDAWRLLEQLATALSDRTGDDAAANTERSAA